jgi:hypothetical protein
MKVCPTCGADRTRLGILYPARRLCACEPRRCASCTQPAVVVEYQQITSAFDAPLPAVSDRKTKFFCPTHNASAVKVEIPLKAIRPVARAIATPKAAKPVELLKKQVRIAASVTNEPTKRRKSSDKPHISPAWCLRQAPPDSSSQTAVECAGCRSTHPMHERRNFNGTKSECPACGFVVFTHAYEESHESR